MIWSLATLVINLCLTGYIKHNNNSIVASKWSLKIGSRHDANFLLSLVGPQVVVTTTCGDTRDDKVGIVITRGFQWRSDMVWRSDVIIMLYISWELWTSQKGLIQYTYVEYIPEIIHTVLLCLVLLWLYHMQIHVAHLPMFRESLHWH